jgi:hypothetical protein
MEPKRTSQTLDLPNEIDIGGTKYKTITFRIIETPEGQRGQVVFGSAIPTPGPDGLIAMGNVKMSRYSLPFTNLTEEPAYETIQAEHEFLTDRHSK